MSRRTFNSTERAALFVAADGKCEMCAVDLSPGWHADHLYPYSRGGPTDVVNGQALCPPCNLKKGNTVTPNLSRWQSDALDKFKTSPRNDFFVVATPGAGKTRLALAAAAHFKSQHATANIVVVVPNTHLRAQWAKAAHSFGLSLDYRFDNSQGAPARDFDGVVVTYSAVHRGDAIYRRMMRGRSTLVIMDEVHHVGDERSWGETIGEAFKYATRRFLMSGTPNRTDGTSIPFVPYDKDGFYDEDYLYDYGHALRDKRVDPATGVEFPVVRPVAFRTQDGEARWISAGQAEETVQLADAGKDEMSIAMKSALDPDGEWIKSVIRAANDELSEKRLSIPDTGGLVIAQSQWHAEKYARIIYQATGEKPTVAISDDPDASEHISRFTNDSSRWIVAVGMVSEGVDIPRLGVCVYATNVQTELFFRQVMGRIVRSRGPRDIDMAAMFIPAIQPFVEFASTIESTIRKALVEQQAAEEMERGEGTGCAPGESSTIILPSGAAVEHDTIVAGEKYSRDELARAEKVRQMLGDGHDVFTLVKIARVMAQVDSAPTLPVPPAPSLPSLTEQKEQVKRDIKRLAGKVDRELYGEWGQTNKHLLKIGFPTRDKMTLDELRDARAFLQKCVSERMTILECYAAA